MVTDILELVESVKRIKTDFDYIKQIPIEKIKKLSQKDIIANYPELIRRYKLKDENEFILIPIFGAVLYRKDEYIANFNLTPDHLGNGSFSYVRCKGEDLATLILNHYNTGSLPLISERDLILKPSVADYAAHFTFYDISDGNNCMTYYHKGAEMDITVFINDGMNNKQIRFENREYFYKYYKPYRYLKIESPQPQQPRGFISGFIHGFKKGLKR